MASDIERQIEGVQSQILEVERQLRAVHEQLREAAGPPDKDYLREKERDLRKEKEQLRKKEEHLREKELLILKSEVSVAPKVLGLQDVLYKCDEFWKMVAEAIPKMAKPRDFKQSYARCGRTICTIQGYPSLLWDGLETSPFQLARLLQEAEEKRSECCVILDVSGAGKTRSLYELAAAEPCLFFAGCNRGPSGNEGSADILEVCSALLRLCPQGAISSTAMVCCVGAMVLCRLYLLERSRKAIPGFSHIMWLFKQAAFKYLGYPVTDPFQALTRNVLDLMQNSNSISELSTVLMTEISRLRVETGVRTLILDECQLVDELLVGRFDELFNINGESSFLYALIDSFYSFGFQKVYVSGTGHRLVSIAARLSMMLKPKTPVCRFHLAGFDSPQELEAYTRLYITDTSDFDFLWLWSLYAGRYRFYVTALERFIYLSQNSTGLRASEFMYNFAHNVVTQCGEDLKLAAGKSIRDQVEAFFAKHKGERVSELVECLVVLYFFGGVGALKSSFRSQDLRLVEYGLARLLGKGGPHGSVELLRLLDFERLGHCTLVQLAEPLVCWAMWEYVSLHPEDFKEFQVQYFLRRGHNSHSQAGCEYEVVTATSLGELFDGKKPVDVLRPSTGRTYTTMQIPIYNVAFRLCRPEIQRGPVVQSVSKSWDGSVGLLRWFEMVMGGASYFPTFLHTGPEQSFGPNLVFLLDTDLDSLGKRYLPVLCQARTGEQSKKMTSAWNSLSVDRLYLHGRTKVRTPAQDMEVEVLKQMCEDVGCIKLVLANGKVNLQSGGGKGCLHKKLEDQEEAVKIYLEQVQQGNPGGVPAFTWCTRRP